MFDKFRKRTQEKNLGKVLSRDWLEFYSALDQTGHLAKLDSGALKEVAAGLDFRVYKDGDICVKQSYAGFKGSRKQMVGFKEALDLLIANKPLSVSPFDYEIRHINDNQLSDPGYEIVIFMPWLETNIQHTNLTGAERSKLEKELLESLKKMGLEITDVLQFGTSTSGPKLYDLSSVSLISHR